jgi:large subunit ribosomal protein L29
MVELVKTNEIRKLSQADLEKKAIDLKSELFNLRFQLATGQLDNPSYIKSVKKDIARVKTILRERELGIRKEA